MENNEHNLLIVDDSAINVTLLKSILKKLNVKISVAFSGKQALSFLNKESFDLIILDIAMPKMNGLQLLGKLDETEKNSETSVIFVSAAEVQEEELKNEKVVGFVAKPIDIEELVEKVKTILKLD